jgi:diguanylate cyclase (GGDEF)-like protein
MTNLLGLAWRSTLALIMLTVVAQLLSYQASSNLRRVAMQQREVDKVSTVSRAIEPQLKREGERVKLVAQLLLMHDELADAMQRKATARRAAVAAILDLTYQQSRVDQLEVTDEDGVVLYRAHEPGRSGDLATVWGIDEALAGRSTLVSTKGARGPIILFIAPVRAAGKIIGTVLVGTQIGDRTIRALSIEAGADLALLTRSGAMVSASAPGKLKPDNSAIEAAFLQKIPIYRTNEVKHTSLVYLPVLIVDDAWVIMAEIDSTPAFALLKKGDQQSALLTLLVLGGSIMIIFIVLRYALKPLRELRRRAEASVVALTGIASTRAAGDDIVSIVAVLDTLTTLLIERNGELTAQRSNLEVEVNRSHAAAAEINQLAFYDSLTKLPNRRFLLVLLEKALAASSRHRRKGALLFIDLDNFKTLNDTQGHGQGDLLLQQVAERILTCVRDGDTVARLGGDEFVVMLKNLSENAHEAASQTENVGKIILGALSQTYRLGSYEHQSTVSIGATLFADRHGSVDELLKRADLAMYQAKAAGRNTLRFFDPEMQAEVTARAALEAALREAVLHHQFVLYYQAQVEHECHLTGAEALVRWNHPQRGMVSPAEFIPVAEETGVILPLGNWVLETGCAQLASWATRPEMAHLTLAVNVSARQFHHQDFVEQVLALLERTGANPQRLKLELTESLLLSNLENVVVKMNLLKKHGVGFSLDDFGTGYSSLAYLKRLPLDQLKIDQVFVRDILIDPNDAAIAKMVIALADSLGLAVIAEGVETEAQRELLARQGCHACQGYLFSRPLPLHEFERLVAEFDARPNPRLAIA